MDGGEITSRVLPLGNQLIGVHGKNTPECQLPGETMKMNQAQSFPQMYYFCFYLFIGCTMRLSRSLTSPVQICAPCSGSVEL